MNTQVLGPLVNGHYIQIGLGLGFYVDEAEYKAVQDQATETRRVQFMGITKAGAALHGTRDEVLNHPDSAGLCAWIFPREVTAFGMAHR